MKLRRSFGKAFDTHSILILRKARIRSNLLDQIFLWTTHPFHILNVPSKFLIFAGNKYKCLTNRARARLSTVMPPSSAPATKTVIVSRYSELFDDIHTRKIGHVHVRIFCKSSRSRSPVSFASSLLNNNKNRKQRWSIILDQIESSTWKKVSAQTASRAENKRGSKRCPNKVRCRRRC